MPKLADKVTRIKQITGPDFNIWIHGIVRFSSADNFISAVASIMYSFSLFFIKRFLSGEFDVNINQIRLHNKPKNPILMIYIFNFIYR